MHVDRIFPVDNRKDLKTSFAYQKISGASCGRRRSIIFVTLGATLAADCAMPNGMAADSTAGGQTRAWSNKASANKGGVPCCDCPDLLKQKHRQLKKTDMASREARFPDAGGSSRTSADYLRASPQLFDNFLLDKLSRVHWSTPLVFYMPVVALLAWLGFTTVAPALVAWSTLVGYAAWTLTEYFGHRYLFHTEFPGSLGARFHFLIHGVHHDHPNDPLRLVMPPLMSAPIMAIALIVIVALVGRPLAYPTLMGFIVGYLIYDMVHYSLHHAEFKTRLGRHLRRLHMLHHFHDAERGFAISAPWWDSVFGTAHLRARNSQPD